MSDFDVMMKNQMEENKRITPVVQTYVGKTPSDFKKDFPKRHTRVVESGSCFTMEYMPARVNLHTDKDGKITHIGFG